MLIRGDDIDYDDVITLGMCFSMFVDFCVYFCFALISENLTAQSMESHRGIEGSCKLSFLFQPCCQSALDCLLASYLSFKSEDEILWCIKPLAFCRRS